MKRILSFILFTIIASGTFAQNGMIRGTVFDGETGEPMFAATVVIANTTTGSTTDFDGKFEIANIEPGTYDLQVSFISYETQMVTGVEVLADDITVVDVELGSAQLELDVVTVEATKLTNTVNSMITMQKKSAGLMDGISSQQISRMGDSDAASSLKRVTGVTVEGGKYIYVRGLGDRYSKTTLNGSEIPGLDPNRNTVQMDLFPSNLINNLVVYKTFTPDMPGDFSGGYVDVSTKDFPDRFTLQVSASLGYNDQSSFQSNFLSYTGSGTDWLGFDNGTRDVPEEAQGDIPAPFTNKTKLEEITKSFNKEMDYTTESSSLNQSYSFSLGNQTKLGGKPFGYIFSLSYSLDYSHFDDGFTGRYNVSDVSADELNPRFLLDDTRSSQNALWGAMFNANYKFNDNNKIGLTLLRNQSGIKETRALTGLWDDVQISNNEIFQSHALTWLQRSLTTAQLKGEHNITKWNNTEIAWTSAVTLSTQDEPDLRFFASNFQVIPGDGMNPADTLFEIKTSGYDPPARYFREMNEINVDNKIHITYPFDNWTSKKGKLKFGASALYKDREFLESQYDYEESSNSFNGSVEDYIADANIDGNNGVYISDATQLRNSYDGRQLVASAYIMTDLPLTENLRLVTGLRFEQTDIEVESRQASLPKGSLTKGDILPSFNLTWQLVENMNIRVAYSRTIARPNFRELAPYSTFDFTGDFILSGNAELMRTNIDNADLRWEYFMDPGEIISASVFFKNFKNPIEKAIVPEAANLELRYVNVEGAIVYGVEVEMRKHLGFISEGMKNFMLGFNASYIKSVVDINAEELEAKQQIDPNISDTRTLFGQSPFIVNAFASYDNRDLGFNATVSYNVFGKRLAIVSRGALPDVFEMPRNSLNVVVQKSIGKRFNLKVSAKNLLNPDYKMVLNFKDSESIYSLYTRGRSYSIGLTYLIN